VKFAGLAMVLLIAGGFGVTAESVIQLTDQMGNVVEIPQPVERFASVYGIGTYFAYALGVDDRLVKGWYIGVKSLGQASEAMYRLEPRLPDLLSSGDPNIEEMVATGATLIFVDGARHAGFAEQMSDLGVAVIQFMVESPDALLEAMQLAATAFGEGAIERAHVFAADFHRVLARISADIQEASPLEAPRVLFLGTDPLTVSSGDMYQSWMIEAAGGIHVSSELTGYWNEVNLEQILLWDPEIIVIPPYGPVQPASLLGNPDWQAISAIRNGRVHRMPRVIAPMDTPVPESLLGIVWLAELLHPEVVGFNLEEEMERFYAYYYSYELSATEMETLLSQ